MSRLNRQQTEVLAFRACLAWLAATFALGMLPGPASPVAFHLSVWAVAGFGLFLPGPRALVFGLVAAGLGLAVFIRHSPLSGPEAFLCQTAVLVLMGFLPSLFSGAEQRKALEREIILEHNRKTLEALHHELDAMREETAEQMERSKTTLGALKRLAA
jgi:hypothetical protein